MAPNRTEDAHPGDEHVPRYAGALTPETLLALGFRPPFLPIQTQFGQQIAAIVAASSRTEPILQQLTASGALAAATASAGDAGLQRMIAQTAGFDRLSDVIAASGGTSRFAEVVTRSAGIAQFLGTDRLTAAFANSPGLDRIVAQLGTDRLTAALGQTVAVQETLAKLGGSPQMARIAASALSFMDTSGFKEQYLSRFHSLSSRIGEQMGWFAAHQDLALASPVLRVNRAWRLAASSEILLDAPETLLDFGRGALAVNRAAYTVETQETPSGEIWYVARAAEAGADEHSPGALDELLAWLEGVDQKLPRKYKGAWNAIGQRGPDWISQSANSGMELLDWALRTLAPDIEVIAWQQSTGLYASEKNPDNGKPHRILRCRYIAHIRGLPARALDDLIAGVQKAVKILQKIKHADEDVMAEALRSSLVSIEYCLMIMWRGA